MQFGKVAEASAHTGYAKPTAEMLAELEAAGVALPDEAAMLALSKAFQLGLDRWRAKMGKGPSTTWLNLFNDLDTDGKCLTRCLTQRFTQRFTQCLTRCTDWSLRCVRCNRLRFHYLR